MLLFCQYNTTCFLPKAVSDVMPCYHPVDMPYLFLECHVVEPGNKAGVV